MPPTYQLPNKPTFNKEDCGQEVPYGNVEYCDDISPTPIFDSPVVCEIFNGDLFFDGSQFFDCLLFTGS